MDLNNRIRHVLVQHVCHSGDSRNPVKSRTWTPAFAGVTTCSEPPYEAIDWQIAHAIATRHMSDFVAFATAVVAPTGIRDSSE